MCLFQRLSCVLCWSCVACENLHFVLRSSVTLVIRTWRVTRKLGDFGNESLGQSLEALKKSTLEMDTSRQIGQVVVDPGRTECTVRGATELGVMPGDGYKKVGTWRVGLCFGKDLGS